MLLLCCLEGKKIELLLKSNAAELAKAEAGSGCLLCTFSCRLALVLKGCARAPANVEVLQSIFWDESGLGLNAATPGPQALTLGAQSLSPACAQRHACALVTTPCPCCACRCLWRPCCLSSLLSM